MADRDLVFKFEFRFPRWGARRWAGAALAVAVVGGAIAYANVMWTPFMQGEKLSSAKMNANFTAMANAIDALQNAPPPNAPQPHVVTNMGNLDLGISLGSTSLWRPGPPPGWQQDARDQTYSCSTALLTNVSSNTAVTFGSRYYCPWPIAYSATLKAPLLIGLKIGLAWDGKNCTGNAYFPDSITQGFSNLAFNTQGGTIYQLSGPPQNAVAVSHMDDQGNCAPTGMWMLSGVNPVQDTKVPNIPVTDLTQTHMAWM